MRYLISTGQTTICYQHITLNNKRIKSIGYKMRTDEEVQEDRAIARLNARYTQSPSGKKQQEPKKSKKPDRFYDSNRNYSQYEEDLYF